jgi:hypothetical protein
VCTITTPGNGPSNAVRIRVVANNAIGSSTPVAIASNIWSDVVPPAPTGLNATVEDSALRVSWNAVTTPGDGSPVDSYVVTANGVAVDPGSCSGSTCTDDIAGLPNGQVATITVSARNGAYPGLTTWNSSSISGVPAGPPLQTGTPAASATDNSIDVDWTGDFGANGSPITGYVALKYLSTDPQPACPSSGFSGGTTAHFSGLSSDSTYLVIVYAQNARGCSTNSAAVQVETQPGVIDAATFGGPTEQSVAWDVTLTGASSGSSTFASGYTFYYQLSTGASGGPIALGQPLFDPSGAQYGQDGLTVQLRACHGAVCQATLSAPIALGLTPVNPQVANVTLLAPSDPLASAGTFSWTSTPVGPGYTSIQYNCGNGWVTADPSTQGGSCVLPLVDPSPSLIYRVTANGGTTYDATYDQNGSVQ